MKKLVLFLILSFIISISFNQGLYETTDGNDSDSGSLIQNQELQLNNNKIHDSPENRAQTKNSVFVHYESLPTDADVAALDAMGVSCVYKGKYINVIQTNEVDRSMLERITDVPGITSIEPVPEIKRSLDISARALKARESDEYSPNTVWEIGYSGYGINIAILDGGVDDDHPSLVNKFVAGVDFTGTTGQVKPKDGSFNPDDYNGHGTALAGIAFGTGGFDEYYRGIAPEAKLIDVKAVGGVSNQIMNALEWCLDHQYSDWNNNGEDEYDGIDIISLSLSVGEDSDGQSAISQLLNTVVQAGIVVVTAGGNDGPYNNGFDDIAATDRVITVGNIDDMNTISRDDDSLNPSSNVGPRRDDGDDSPYDELKPDVVAPGTDIMAPQFSLIGQNGNGYDTITGTSASCPHVSGICALMLEANPNLRPRDIKKILQNTAETIGEPDEPELSDKYNYAYGYGSIDAYSAVKMAIKGVINNAPVLTSLTASALFVEPQGEAYITTIAADPDGDELRYLYEVSGGEIYGTGPHVIWVAPEEVGEYLITAQVDDGALYSESVSITITVELEPHNHAPVIESVKAEPTVVEPYESSTINVSAYDPDGDFLDYEYEVSGGSISGAGPQVVWIAPGNKGSYEIKITVSDGELSTEFKVKIRVEGGPDNKPPDIESFTADKYSVSISESVILQVIASDPEMGELDYIYFTESGEIGGSGALVTWTGPKTPGDYIIEVTVFDNMGLSDNEDISIEVIQPNIAPVIKEKKAYPDKVLNDGTVEVLFTVKIDDENGPDDIAQAIIDLSSILGSEKQKMYDNGKFGDQKKYDGVYSVSYLIPRGVSEGEKTLKISVQDRSGESTSDTLNIDLTTVAAEESNEGLIADFLPLPGFEAELLILAFFLIIIIFGSKRIKFTDNYRKV